MGREALRGAGKHSAKNLLIAESEQYSPAFFDVKSGKRSGTTIKAAWPKT